MEINYKKFEGADLMNYTPVEILRNSVKMCINSPSTNPDMPETIYVYKKHFNYIMPLFYMYGRDMTVPMFLIEREYNQVNSYWLAIPKTI